MGSSTSGLEGEVKPEDVHWYHVAIAVLVSSGVMTFLEKKRFFTYSDDMFLLFGFFGSLLIPVVTMIPVLAIALWLSVQVIK